MTPARACCSTAWNSDSGGPGVADVPQPHRPVRPVQQVGVALVRAQGLDEPAAARPRATAANGLRALGHSTSAGRTESTGRPAARSAAAIPSGPIRRSGTPNATRTAAPTVSPVAKASEQLHRQHRAGDQPHHDDQEQREPGRPAPRPAQPGRGGHDHGRRGREQRRAGERGAGQPRAAREVVRERGRMPPAEQERRSPAATPAASHRPRGQPGQQPEPALRSVAATTSGRRGHARHLHEAGQDLARRAEAAGHGRGRAEQPAARGPEATSEQAAAGAPPAISRITSPGCR